MIIPALVAATAELVLRGDASIAAVIRLEAAVRSSIAAGPGADPRAVQLAETLARYLPDAGPKYISADELTCLLATSLQALTSAPASAAPPQCTPLAPGNHTTCK